MTRKLPNATKSQRAIAKKAKTSQDTSIFITKTQTTIPEQVTLGISIAQNSQLILGQRGTWSVNDLPSKEQPRDDTMEYYQSIYAGAESLGIAMDTRLRQDIGDRRGELYVPGTSSTRCTTASEVADLMASERGLEAGITNADCEYQFQDGADWGIKLAGIGRQFSYSSIELTKPSN